MSSLNINNESITEVKEIKDRNYYRESLPFITDGEDYQALDEKTSSAVWDLLFKIRVDIINKLEKYKRKK